MVPYDHLAGTLRLVIPVGSARLIQNAAELTEDASFDAIVCVPALGTQPRRENGADGFGGDAVRALAPYLAENGTIFWVTARVILFNASGKRTLANLDDNGLKPAAIIDIALGGFHGTMIEGTIIVLRRDIPSKKFVGVVRDVETAEPMASAFITGPSRKSGPSWTWLDSADQATFAGLERARLLQRLKPRGRHASVTLGSLLLEDRIARADSPVAVNEESTGFLFVPEYAGSSVTAELDEQTVQPKAVHRLAIDPAKANTRFLARLLNSPYGKQIRSDAATGVTIQRVPTAALLSLELPIPDLATQEQIARADSDLGLLEAAFRDMRRTLDNDWTGFAQVIETINSLKAVLDIERKIADWWRELPYPLAAIYRRYQVSQDPKERFDTLLHFFEMAAIYLATLGTSHVRVMRKDWQEVVAKWLHPEGAVGIERTDIGFWIGLAGASLKDANRIASDKELRGGAIELAGPDLVRVAGMIGSAGKATEVLDVARRHRNSWKGHGGYMKPSDAARLEAELQQSVRDLYEITASIFRRVELVRPGSAEYADGVLSYQTERLSGSDPTFDTEVVRLDRPVNSNALAFWMRDTRTMCPALPFFRLGAPQRPRETSFYVFNRVEDHRFRWISYQEASEQEFFAPDDELLGLIALGGSGG